VTVAWGAEKKESIVDSIKRLPLRRAYQFSEDYPSETTFGGYGAKRIRFSNPGDCNTLIILDKEGMRYMFLFTGPDFTGPDNSFTHIMEETIFR
jgi:hypothetical protein